MADGRISLAWRAPLSATIDGSRESTSAKQRQLAIGLIVLAVFALLRVGLLNRHGLWADETFSLAMATGHSLEHPAIEADVSKGDYIESAQAARAADYQKYLEQDAQPASPSRVVRAVFKSDTSPPLYYLLLYGWTRIFGAGDAALRMFSVVCSMICFPLLWWVARQIGGIRTAIIACILFTFSPNTIY